MLTGQWLNYFVHGLINLLDCSVALAVIQFQIQFRSFFTKCKISIIISLHFA